jgi:hypothetical protein
MIRVELKAEEKPSKELIEEFKKNHPEAKIRFMKEGKIFLYIDENKEDTLQRK